MYTPTLIYHFFNFKLDNNTLRKYDLPIEILIAGMFSIMLVCSAVFFHLPEVRKNVKVYMADFFFNFLDRVCMGC